MWENHGKSSCVDHNHRAAIETMAPRPLATSRASGDDDPWKQWEFHIAVVQALPILMPVPAPHFFWNTWTETLGVFHCKFGSQKRVWWSKIMRTTNPKDPITETEDSHNPMIFECDFSTPKPHHVTGWVPGATGHGYISCLGRCPSPWCWHGLEYSDHNYLYNVS